MDTILYTSDIKEFWNLLSMRTQMFYRFEATTF